MTNMSAISYLELQPSSKRGFIMPMNSRIDPSGFYLEGGKVAALLLHGFTGSPAEMRLVGDNLHQYGLTVSAPLLPGHGTTAEDLNNYGWNDWVMAATEAFEDIREKRNHIFIAGLSMGSLLTLYLAGQRQDAEGIIVYSAALEPTDWRSHFPSFLARFMLQFVQQLGKSEEHWANPEAKSLLWSYDTYPTKAGFDLLQNIPDVIELLPNITCPLLSIYGTEDDVVSVDGVQKLYDRVNSQDKELIAVEGAGHVITLDAGWETVAEKTYAFIEAHIPAKELMD